MVGSKLAALTIISHIVCVFGGNTNITRTYGQLNPFFNQTATGYFRRVVGSEEVVRVPSIWMQDDVSKRMRIDVGKRGEPGFVAEFYFFENSTYELFSGQNGTVDCKKIPDFNYSMEISTYGEPNFGFLGRHVLQEYNSVVADVYAGQAIDGVGLLNCIFYCDAGSGKQFLGLTIMGAANKFSFLEYWFGDSITTEIPPNSWFALPSECANAKVENFFDSHNADGTNKPHSLHIRSVADSLL